MANRRDRLQRTRATACGLVCAVVTSAGGSQALAQDARSFSINGGASASVIHNFASQSGLQIVASSELLQGRRFNSVQGAMTSQAALEQLLSGSGLRANFVSDRSVALVPVAGGAGENREDVGVLEEIVVTAQRREQSLQDVPLAVTALGADAMAERGIRDFASYLRTVPGAAVAELGNTGNEIKLRGVGTGTSQLSPTTAVYLGEVPVIHTGRGLNSSFNFRLVDIERVEVLRGPQGQLYGSNSLGGAIKNVPARPRLDAFATSGSATISTTREGGENYDGDVTLNVPIARDVAGVRLTGYWSQQSGWIDNVFAGGPTLASLAAVAPPLIRPTLNGVPVAPPAGAPWAILPAAVRILSAPVTGGPPGPPVTVAPGILALNPAAASYRAPANLKQDVNSTNVHGVRLTGAWEPSETFSADLLLAYETKETHGTSWTTEIPNVPGPIAGTVVVPRTTGTPIPYLYPSSAKRYEQINPFNAGNSDEIFLASLTLNYDFGFATLTSATSYWDRTEVLESDLGVLAYVTTGVAASFPTVVARTDKPKSYIQEFRLTSPGEGRFQWIAGLFLQRIEQDYRVDVTDFSGLDIIYTDRLVRANLGQAGSSVPASRLLGLQTGKFRDDQVALFGELSYDLTSTLNATFSFRWFELDQTSSLINQGFFFSGQGNSSRQNNERIFTPKFNLSWKPDSDKLFYATAAQGFRTGITNRDLPIDLCRAELRNVGQPGGVGPTESDTLWNYELGAKMTFAQRRVTVNGAVYYIDWSDLQSQVILSAFKDPAVVASQCNFDTILNVGDASIRGAELEISARATTNLRFDAAFAYTDPQYQSNYPAVGIRKGQTIEGTPRFTSFVGARYDFDLASRPSFVRLDWNYTGKIAAKGTDFQRQALVFPIGDFHTFAARASMELTDQVSFDLWAENLTDEFGVTRAVDFGGDNLPTYFPIRPRTIGATIRWTN